MKALALEVPVIASMARGNEELVDAHGGLMFPTRDVHALAAKMDWLLDHPTERLEMGRSGRSRMVERYDVHRLLRMHDQMYSAMLTEEVWA